MASRAESETRLKVKNGTAVCLILLLPCGTDKQLFTDGNGFEIFFPVVLPVGIFAHTRVYLILYACGGIALAQESDGLLRVLLRRDIYMDYALRPVLFEQILIDEVDVRYLHRLLLKGTVVLNIYSVRHDHVRYIACGVNIVCINGYLNFCPVHSLLLIFYIYFMSMFCGTTFGKKYPMSFREAQTGNKP